MSMVANAWTCPAASIRRVARVQIVAHRYNERCSSCYEAAGPLGDVVAVLSPPGIARGRCRTRLPEETSDHVYDRN